MSWYLIITTDFLLSATYYKITRQLCMHVQLLGCVRASEGLLSMNFLAKILELAAISHPRRSSQCRNQTCTLVPRLGRWFFTPAQTVRTFCLIFIMKLFINHSSILDPRDLLFSNQFILFRFTSPFNRWKQKWWFAQTWNILLYRSALKYITQKVLIFQELHFIVLTRSCKWTWFKIL